MPRRRDVRRFGPGPYILGLEPAKRGEGFPFVVPAVADVAELELDAAVTLLAGDNRRSASRAASSRRRSATCAPRWAS